MAAFGKLANHTLRNYRPSFSAIEAAINKLETTHFEHIAYYDPKGGVVKIC